MFTFNRLMYNMLIPVCPIINLPIERPYDTLFQLVETHFCNPMFNYLQHYVSIILLIILSLEILNRIKYKLRITNYVLLNSKLMKTP